MRILHFYDRIPDPRIERAAQLSKNMGHDVHFLGEEVDGYAIGESYFDSLTYVTLQKRQKLGIFDSQNINLLKEKIDLIDPDVIHAHDLVNAHMIHKIYPERLIYDDHEYWSKQVHFSRVKMFNRFIPNLKHWFSIEWMKLKAEKWQTSIQQNSHIIASSKKIAEFHRNDGAKFVYYIPNMPTLQEVENFTPKNPKTDDLYGAFLGRDISIPKRPAYRNTDGLIDNYQSSKLGKFIVIGDRNLESDDIITSIGVVPHMECYPELSQAHYGVLGFKSHPALGYKSAQKVHMYIHSGLVPFVTPEQYNLLEYLQPKAIIYNDFQHLKSQILKNRSMILNHSHEEYRSWARENVILDDYQENLSMAYENVVG